MKQIPLSKGQFALVDDADFSWLNQFKWYFKGDKSGNGYARRTIYKPKKKTISMHGLIFGDQNGFEPDHKDGDGLNNQRYNLRKSTRSQNNMNRDKSGGGKTSKYKGVHWSKSSKKWMVKIKKDKNLLYLGTYDDEIIAAATYNVAARKYHGEYAVLNIIEGEKS